MHQGHPYSLHSLPESKPLCINFQHSFFIKDSLYKVFNLKFHHVRSFVSCFSQSSSLVESHCNLMLSKMSQSTRQKTKFFNEFAEAIQFILRRLMLSYNLNLHGFPAVKNVLLSFNFPSSLSHKMHFETANL